MLRFCRKGLFEQSEGITVIMAEQQLVFNDQIWQEGRTYFRQNLCHDTTTMPVIPVLSASGGTVCYGWQDHEANRELRMLKELEKSQGARQFNDLFPDITEVIICGCNELAYRFAKYLERLKIPVSVCGRYWDYFGYKVNEDPDFDAIDKLIIQAERVLDNAKNLFQRVIRSASAEFECIDRIYEANVLAGNIRDTEGDFNKLLEKLKDREVVILGIDEKAQDMYDLLLAHGIDIRCFAVERTQGDGLDLLLGKRVETIASIMHDGRDVSFVGVQSRNSAWGNQWVELFDYYGYERNEKFFFARDYTDIPISILVHVLKGKAVVLTGDERLCRILTDYLTDIEQGDIRLRYIKVLQEGVVNSTEIVCAVNLWYGPGASEKRIQFLGAYLEKTVYTNYFSSPGVFVSIDQYRKGLAEKYTIKQLIPKGIVLNITFYNSGNVFFRGVMDGHPNILSIQFNAFVYNLFVYCIRLSTERAQNILSVFQTLLKTEMSTVEFNNAFPHWSRFQRSLENWLSIRERFTSQELFVIFHIAYEEMMRGEKITDISRNVIYFDPHGFPVMLRSFLAKWLESDAVNEQIITIHRDDVTNICSFYTRSAVSDEKMKLARDIVWWMVNDKMCLGMDRVDFQCCKRFEVRFEDLKLHPREQLAKICERIEIPWSDTLMHTTYWGRTSDMGTIRDFDLKPVFNRHVDHWSEFDRFRLYLLCSPYQKRYGYPYEDCSKFSRTQLWELFLKTFCFQDHLQFETVKDKTAYYFGVYELIRWRLYDNRRHLVMDDLRQEFKPIETGKTVEELKMERRKEKYDLAGLISEKEKIVLYGMGRDGRALWGCLDESVRSALVLCDKKAEKEIFYFQDKQVISPLELCTKYMDYEILVTSSRFYREISAELDAMGVDAYRIHCNTVQLWEGDDRLG